jgi:hypothetical protein
MDDPSANKETPQCPGCHCLLEVAPRGYSWAKGLFGCCITLGPWGLLLGFLGSKEMFYHCPICRGMYNTLEGYERGGDVG